MNNRTTVPLAISIVAMLLAIAALVTAYQRRGDTGQVEKENALARIKREGVIHAAYAGFPPYSIVDVNESDRSKKASGFSIDLIEEIAQRQQPPLKVQWHLVNFETMKADIDSGRIDVIADPVYQTSTRAGSGFGFCEPFTYVGNALAIVRKDETRFATFQDLNRDDITIAVAIGWASTDFAKQNLSKPKWKMVSVSNTAVEQFDDVVAGRADVALNDTPSVITYARAHPDTVKVLWQDAPPSFVAAGFMTRDEDAELQEFLSVSVRALIVDGTVERLDRKWKTLGYFQKREMIPGEGLSND